MNPNVIQQLFVVHFTRVPTTDPNGIEIPGEWWVTYNHCEGGRYKHRRGGGYGNFHKHLKTKHPNILNPLDVIQIEVFNAPPPP